MTLWISIHLPCACGPRCTPLEPVAMALLQYTPELALFDSNSLLLDVGASLGLFKGPRNLCRHIQASLRLMGAHARLGMAPTALGAWLMARQDQTKQRRTLRLTTLVRQLDTLPINTLPCAQPYQDWFNAIGCTTLQHLTRLPRAGLRQRTSYQVLEHLDAAYGKTAVHLDWYQPADTFQASCQLEFHTTATHTLLAYARRLIEQLCGWLQARHHAASCLRLSLHHEKGRHACPPARIVLGLSTPSRHISDFLPLLTEQLQHQQLQAPVIAIDLDHVHSLPDCEPSGHLFPDRAQHQRQENQLIDLLRTRLGNNAIAYPCPVASHIPEQANQWGTATNTQTPVSTQASVPAHTHRPFWLLKQPIPLDTYNNRPLYKGRILTLIQGPERIESGWWMTTQHAQRDYFVARDNQYSRYWIYRQRATDQPGWFLQGLFA